MLSRVRQTVIEATARQQVPWDHSSLIGDFYFRPEASGATPEAPATEAPSTLDVVVWNAIRDSTDPDDFQTFIEEHPDSVLVPYVLNRLSMLRGLDDERASGSSAALQPQAPPEPERPVQAPETHGATPDALERSQAISREDRRLVQLALNDLGYDAGPVDGVLGPRTRSALAAWQRANGYPDTGYLQEEQTAALREHGQELSVRLRADRTVQPGREPVRSTERLRGTQAPSVLGKWDGVVKQMDGRRYHTTIQLDRIRSTIYYYISSGCEGTLAPAQPIDTGVALGDTLEFKSEIHSGPCLGGTIKLEWAAPDAIRYSFFMFGIKWVSGALSRSG